MIVPEKGLHCPREEAWEYANLIPTIDNFSHISGLTHSGFAKESGTTYMELLRKELTEFVDETELDRTLEVNRLIDERYYLDIREYPSSCYVVEEGGINHTTILLNHTTILLNQHQPTPTNTNQHQPTHQ